VYSLDYRLHRFYHKCTAYIIHSTDLITNVKLGLSTQDIFITNAQLRLSTQEILSQMYSLDYLLDRFYHKCTAWIIDSTDFITCVWRRLSTRQIYHKCTALIIDSTNFITHVQLGLSTQQILLQM
jgi:hypothetical protein